MNRPNQIDKSGKRRRRSRPALTVLSSSGEQRQFCQLSFEQLKPLLNNLALYAGELPSDLWDQLRNLLVGLMAEEEIDMHAVDRLRWEVVCEEIARVGYQEAFAAAAEKLRHSPFAGGEDAMRKSYERYQRSLPPEQRRPRSYRRHTTGV
jgi:hypothetical protein